MDGFVRRENIKRYWKLLREVNDEPGRRVIQKLLLEEEQKEVPIQTPSPMVIGRTSSAAGAWCARRSSSREVHRRLISPLLNVK